MKLNVDEKTKNNMVARGWSEDLFVCNPNRGRLELKVEPHSNFKIRSKK